MFAQIKSFLHLCGVKTPRKQDKALITTLAEGYFRIPLEVYQIIQSMDTRPLCVSYNGSQNLL